MARIPTPATSSPKPWRVLSGPGAVKIGAIPSSDPSGMGGTLVSVGLTDGAIGWNPNIETLALMSDQLYNPHGMVETAWAHQLTFNLDQLDIWNFALSMSYDQDAVTGSSMLELDGNEPSPYRCIRVESEGAKDTADAAAITQYIDFWKSKILASGEISISREAKRTIPVIAHGLGNSSDIVGALSVTAAITKPVYE